MPAVRLSAPLLAAAALASSLAWGMAHAAPASASEAVPLSAFPRERIAIETRASFRRLLFEAWRADSFETRAQGFMFVRDDQVRPDQAMIFVYDPPEYVAMWMKNTLLPLDMLFVDAGGCIVTVRERAKPGSLENIPSGQPTALVVELKAGTVAAHGIKVGDRVLRIDAGWPAAPTGKCAGR
jgi:uncharacterized membrane protein (UPF0127 family)